MPIRDCIVPVLELNDGEIAGIFNLGYRVLGIHDLNHLRKILRDLEAEGIIEVVERKSGTAKIVRLKNHDKIPV